MSYNNMKRVLVLSAMSLLLSTLASATAYPSIQSTLCAVILAIYGPIAAIGGSLVLLMIVYAGVKYVYSADDPGGRKQAKSIIVNAIIGGVILLISVALFRMIASGGWVLKVCPGMT